MRAAIISAKSKSSIWIEEAMKKYFDKVDHLNIKNIEVHMGIKNPDVLYEGEPIKKYDCVYARGSFRYADLLRSVTSILGPKCYMPVKASAFTCAHNKLLTQLKVDPANIKSPKTYFAASTEAARSILGKMTFPIIMKFPHGTHGKGVMFADSFESASSMLDALSVLNQPLLIQEYVETGGVDIRAIVVGGKVVAAMKRESVTGEKRANIHQGGTGTPIKLSKKATNMAVETAKTMECDILAVDLLEGPRGVVFLEANLSPGLQGITATTKIDIADLMAKMLYEKSKLIKDVATKTGTEKIMKEIGIGGEQEIIISVDFRGERILLPELATNISKFKEGQEIVLKGKKGNICLEQQ